MEQVYYIARDKFGALYLYEDEPIKQDIYFYPKDGQSCYDIDNALFPTVTFTNSPQKVKLELINYTAVNQAKK